MKDIPKHIVDVMPNNLIETLTYIRDELKIEEVDVIPQYDYYFDKNTITKYSIYEKYQSKAWT